MSHEVAQLDLVDAGDLLHGDHGHDEEQVALDHVLERARAVVVARAALESERLVGDDVDVADVDVVPHGLEDPVAEAQPEQVENGGLPEEVVDPEGLRLGDDAREQPVEARRASPVVAERLLERELQTLRQLHRREQLAGLDGHLRR